MVFRPSWNEAVRSGLPWLVTVLLLASGPGNTAAWAQVDAPPGSSPAKLSKEERARRLAERDRLSAQAREWRRAGKLAEAAAALGQAIAIERELLGPRHAAVVTTLRERARVYEAMDDWAAARADLEEVLTIRRNDPSRWQWRIDDARRALEDVDRRAAMSPETRLRWQRADALNQRFSDLTGGVLGWESGVAAEPAGLEALKLYREVVGEGRPEVIWLLISLARLREGLGDAARGGPMLRHAVALAREVLGEAHPEYGLALDCLAHYYRTMGDSARAEPLYLEALQVALNATGEGSAGHARALLELATFYQSRGDYTRAESLYRQALEIRRKLAGVDDAGYARMLSELATLYQSRGDYTRAGPMLHQAMEIRKKTLGSKHLKYAESLVLLCNYYLDMGDFAQAEQLYREALVILRPIDGTEGPNHAAHLACLSVLYQIRGDSARARQLLTESLAVQYAYVDNASAQLAERERIRLLQKQRYCLDRYLSISLTEGPDPADLYRKVLDWKGAAGAAQDEVRLVRDQPDLRPILERLAGVRARLARLAFATPDEAHRANWQRQLDALRQEKENLEAELARQSAALRRERQVRRWGPEELAAVLPSTMALVDFLEYRHTLASKERRGPSRSEPRVIAFVVRRGRPLACVQLGAARPIDEALEAWMQALTAQQAAALAATAAELGRRVWEPVRPHLDGVRTVQVAPDGALVRFPFAALPGSRPGSYLIEELAIGYVASGRQAATAPSDADGPAGRGLLAAGAIDFRASPGRAPVPVRPAILLAPPSAPVTMVQRAGFRPLPGTEAEVRGVGALFRAAYPDQPAELLTGAEATEAELKRQLDGRHWRVIHLATHGFFDSPARIAALRAASLEGTGDSSPELDPPREQDRSFELLPLLRSGIVLAGGGREPDAEPGEIDGPAGASGGGSTREDGILTAEEVAALDLRGCELVILSGCETGLGQREGGQGVLGLQRAFLDAGARAVVASLWKVDDAATAVLMEQFYTNLWTRKLPTPEALRQAQLAVLNDPGLVERHRTELAQRGLGPKAGKLAEGGRIVPAVVSNARRDPALWAAFVLSGNAR
jgi:CHAT domain-containing protein/Tfp pilus assembly protein PilF